jgi:formylglycine-generating enzyme required for sulfatase activity
VDGREFPWGARFHRRRAKIDIAPHRLAIVESYPLGASPYGALNTCGNVMEWTRTFYRGDAWVNVAKGGCYLSVPASARCAHEHAAANAGSYEEVGFRVLLELD